MSNKTKFNAELLDFLQQSPTPFHAVATMKSRLEQAGFETLDEAAAWTVKPGGKYLVTRNDSSLVAFVHGKQPLVESGIHMVGAHTDSPCLKVKPNADITRYGYHQLGLEVYGGVLLNPWFDRDLSLAGRVSCKTKKGGLQHCLIDFERAVATIPSLAIHLDRGVNEKRNINKQTDLPVVIALEADDKAKQQSFKSVLLKHIRKHKLVTNADSVLDYEICLYDTQPPALVGLNEEFIASARLDNLLSCFAGMQALLNADKKHTSLLVCNDHEEVGSASAVGANGPLLHDCLIRLAETEEQLIRTLQGSMMVSADNAHGIHPNHARKHDGKHGPVLNKGVVLKINANQRYASNSDTSARFRLHAEAAGAEVQSFVVRSDMGCGSTIGPITATELGVPTVDVGVPTFAMHSIRELAGSDDACELGNILKCFFNRK